MSNLRELINQHMSTVPEQYRAINNRTIVPEEVGRVSDDLAKILNDRLAPMNETPVWDEMTNDQKWQFKEHIARNPLWVSQQV